MFSLLENELYGENLKKNSNKIFCRNLFIKIIHSVYTLMQIVFPRHIMKNSSCTNSISDCKYSFLVIKKIITSFYIFRTYIKRIFSIFYFILCIPLPVEILHNSSALHCSHSSLNPRNRSRGTFFISSLILQTPLSWHLSVLGFLPLPLGHQA